MHTVSGLKSGFVLPKTGFAFVGIFAYIVALSIGSLSFLGGLLVCGVLTSFFVRPKDRRACVSLTIAVSFAGLSLLKEPESDQLYYMWFIERIRENGLAFLNISEGITFAAGFSIRATEPLFVLYSFLLSQFEYGSLLFVLCSTLIIYIVYAKSLFIVSDELRIDYVHVLLFACLLSVSVFSAGHLTRQYLGCVVFFLGFALLLRGNWFQALLLIVLSVGVHNSMALLNLFAVISAMFLRWPRFTSAVLVPVVIVGKNYADGFDLILGMLDKDDGAIPTFLILADSAIFTVLFGGVVLGYWRGRVAMLLAGFALGLAAFLVAVSGLKLLFLRTYLTMEFLRPFLIAFLLSQLTRDSQVLAGRLLAVLAATYFTLRFEGTVWNYGGGFMEVLTTSLMAALNRIGSFYSV